MKNARSNSTGKQTAAGKHAHGGAKLEAVHSAKWWVSALALATITLIAACAETPDDSGPPPPVCGETPDVNGPPPPPPPPGGEVRFDVLVTGLNTPVALTNAGDERLFVAERAGAIRIVEDGALLPEPFLDISSSVASGEGEQGLLGLAFPPDYDSSGVFYVYYTRTDGRGVLARVAVDGTDPNRADISSLEEVRVLDDVTAYHNGGQLAFGPDECLYWAVGDAQVDTNAQSLATLRGKILRLDVSGSTGYEVPADNPFVDDAAARPEIWAYGLRNPWRFSFDSETGELYIADVGEDAYEEVNVAAPGVGGQNYGWPMMEGPECFPGTSCDPEGLTLPAFSYPHPADGGASITGGYVYHGPSAPDLVGQYVYGDFMQTYISAAAVDDGWEVTELGTGPWRTASFGVGYDQKLYVTDYGGGIVYEVTQEEE